MTLCMQKEIKFGVIRHFRMVEFTITTKQLVTSFFNNYLPSNNFINVVWEWLELSSSLWHSFLLLSFHCVGFVSSLRVFVLFLFLPFHSLTRFLAIRFGGERWLRMGIFGFFKKIYNKDCNGIIFKIYNLKEFESLASVKMGALFLWEDWWRIIRLLLFCFWENGGAIFLSINFWEFWMQVWKELSVGWYGRWIDDEQFNVFSHLWTDDNYNSLSNKKWWILMAIFFFSYNWSSCFFFKAMVQW